MFAIIFFLKTFSSLTLCLILTLKENVGKNEKRKTKQLKAQHPTTDKLEQIPTSEGGGLSVIWTELDLWVLMRRDNEDFLFYLKFGLKRVLEAWEVDRQPDSFCSVFNSNGQTWYKHSSRNSTN